MSAETALYATLTGAAPVTALVGETVNGNPNYRIYSDDVPQEKVLPAVAFSRMETTPVMTIHTSDVIAAQALEEVWCMATTRAGAEALADAVKNAIATAGFTMIDKRFERDPANDIYSTVFTYSVWE